MQSLRRKTLTELMADEIQREAEAHERRCKELHEKFEERLRRRNEARAALPSLDKEVSKLQGVGVSLLGRLNTATTGEDEAQLEEFRKGYKRNARQLDKAGRRRDRAARRLAAADLAEEEAARELARAASAVVKEHAARVQDIKERLGNLLEALDEHHEDVTRAAAPLEEEYELRRPDGETRRDEEADRGPDQGADGGPGDGKTAQNS